MSAAPSAGGSPAHLDLLWVTNIATPYRVPFWTELGRRLRLGVALMADQEHNRQWEIALDDDAFAVLRCRARALYRTDDNTVYAPSRRLLAAVAARPAAVVIDGWESPAYLATMAAARLLRVPVYASYRTAGAHRFPSGPVAAVRRRFLCSARAVLTAGPASTAAVCGMGVPRGRIVEGFNSVDVARFAAGAAAARTRLADRPPARGHRFLFVGMLIERKNVSGLIRAFASIRRPHDTLTIVGTGPLEAQLRRVAAEAGLADAVTFRGHLDGDELTAAYGEADTFVLSSHQEVWGLVVNEALASGLHAVVADTAGVTPSITGMPGVFPAPATVDGLATAMVRSREQWRGPLHEHPITRHTPAALAEIVAAMVTGGPPAGRTGQPSLSSTRQIPRQGRADRPAAPDVAPSEPAGHVP